MGSQRARAPGRTTLALSLAVAALAAPLPSARPVAAQSTLSALQTDVDQIARRARPSVVTVFAQSLPQGETQAPAAAGRVHTRVGSGVAVDESLILTTASVVLGADRVLVRTSNALQVEAVLVGLDPIYNVALLLVPEVRLPPLRFAAGRPAQVGDWVVALGTSYGAQPTQTLGTVAYRYDEPRVPLLQLSNTVYPGNSGGAALNPRGELVGIVQGELGAPEVEGRGPESERRPSSMGLVLPAEVIRTAYESLRREGRVRHGYLGVTTRWASVESDADASVRVPLGALVESVVPQSPAARADLRRGDLIVGFDGERVGYPEQLARWVAATLPGKAVDLVWVRNEIRRAARLTLTESPNPVPLWAVGSGSAPADTGRLSRISQLEQQMRQINREIGRLKGQTSSVLR